MSGFGIVSSIGLEYLNSLSRKDQLVSQYKTTKAGAEATEAEAEDLKLSTQFELGELEKQSAANIAELEARFAEMGQGLTTDVRESLLRAKTQHSLQMLMEKRSQEFNVSQLKKSAKSQRETATDLDDASDHTFLGGILGF